MTPDDKLVEIVVAALEELKGFDIQVLDVSGLTTITDVMIIASGRSDRQVKSLAAKVAEESAKFGVSPMGREGEVAGEWILVDLYDVVVHIMQPRIRDFYQLEKLWVSDEKWG
ncbi:MAG: ribosome silencing factor [Gammaproteobacteria bacterium]|nr:ribosome silencing factor [Gammaproteobacteria bacterium]